MIKIVVRFIFLAIGAIIVFVCLAIYSGGEKFRWFGKKVEQQSEKIGEKADTIKKGSDEVIRGIEKTTQKVKEFTGSKDSGNNDKSR
ncbi:MAG: hypothetical protein M1497_07065 [Nitrospirae bacterium]|nr:hypothetical protein [Nitrospirota bacterium]